MSWPHLGCGLVTVPGILLHRPQHDGIRPLRDLRVHPRRRHRVFPDMLVGDRDRRVAKEQQQAGEQLVQQAAGRVQVAAGIDPLAPGLLRRQVLGGTDDLRGLRHGGLGVADRPGDAEVHHLDLAIAGQHHVAGLDVAVHDPVAVAVVQGAQHPVGDLQGPLGQQPAVLPEQVAQGAAVHILHDDVGDVRPVGVVLAGVVYRDDRRVVQRGGRLGLAAEPCLERLVPGQVLAEGLHRDDAVQADIPCPVHLGHAAPADDAVELIAAAEEAALCHVSHLSYPSWVVANRWSGVLIISPMTGGSSCTP